MKNLLFFMLALISVIMPARAYDFMADGLCYNYYGDGTTVTVTYERATTSGNGNGYSNLSGDLIIPESVAHDGITYPVVAIGDYAFYGCTALTSVDMPNTLTAIGKRSFHGCTALTSAVLPNSLLSIGEYSFYNCNVLTDVNLPNSLNSIGNNAFENCTSMTTVTIPKSVTSLGWAPFYGCKGLTSVTFNAKSCAIPSGSSSTGLFSGCTKITSFTFGNEVEKIPGLLCASLNGLTSINLPNSLTEIGYKAFRSCSGLTEVTIPNSVKTIGDEAFSHCTGLTSVTIPNSVTSIGNGAFSSCKSLTSVNIPNSITEISSATFGSCYELTSVTIPNTVTKIGSSAFQSCKKLSSIVIPSSVTSIGDYAFRYSGLNSVTIPTSVTSIGSFAFGDCNSLTNVTFNAKSCTFAGSLEYGTAFGHCDYLSSFTFGNEVEIIPDLLCYNLPGLTYVAIPNSVTSIGKFAFYKCSGLTTMSIPNSVTTIDEGAFELCSGLTTLSIGNSVNSIGRNAFQKCTGLSSIIVDSENRKFDSRENCNAIIESASNKLFYGCKSTIIPYSVTTIGEYAFSGCSTLTSITIPSSVSSIGNQAFRECTGLTSVTIPYSVTSIGHAFYGCTGLTSVTIPNTVTSYGNVFTDCSRLASLSLTGHGEWNCNLGYYEQRVKKLYIGSGITSLGNFGFNPDTVFCYAATPPTCGEATFGIYTGELHVPVASVGAYFMANYWQNFNGLINDLNGKVILDKTSASLVQWDTMTLTATFSPSDAGVMWTTSNPNVATVNEQGVVTATGGGECDIYAILDGTHNAAYAVCHVIVSYPEITLSISEESLVMNVADEHELIVAISPDNTGLTPTWTSSNTKIATVVNGVVKAVKEGECDITATVLDKTVTCHVTVTNNMIITLNKDKAIMGASMMLTVYPSCTPDVPVELVVSSSDPTVAVARVVNRTNAPAEGLLYFSKEGLALAHLNSLESGLTKAPALASDKAIMIVGLKNGTATISVTAANGDAEPAILELRVVDVNGDNVVTAADITALYEYLLCSDETYIATSDVNGDGNVTSSDITAIYSILLGN